MVAEINALQTADTGDSVFGETFSEFFRVERYFDKVVCATNEDTESMQQAFAFASWTYDQATVATLSRPFPVPQPAELPPLPDRREHRLADPRAVDRGRAPTGSGPRPLRRRATGTPSPPAEGD
jgi:hypothetical protein